MAETMAINSHAAFCRNVRTLMDVAGISGIQLAKLCDMPQPRISEIMAGKHGKLLETVDRICIGFNSHFGHEVIRPEDLIAESFQIPAEIFSTVN